VRVNAKTAVRVAPALGLLALAALALTAIACAGSGAEASIPGGERTIFLTAVEYKGSAEVAKEPFPTAALPAGGGYEIKAPTGDPPKWEVNAYAWAPSTIVVAEGDRVTLKVIGINGAEHRSEIEGHEVEFTVKRGQITEVAFTAGKPGVYKLVCHTHAPNMTGQLVVLPRK